MLFGDLWRRPELSARDRSLVTIAALIATGQAEQLPFHADRGMDNGLTQTEVAEVPTHLAYYAGWPNAMSALPVLGEVFAARAARRCRGRSASALSVQKYDPEAATTGSAENFTGSVRVESRFQADAPARVGGGTVHFEASARTAWHTHPLGQTLIVTSAAAGSRAKAAHPGSPAQVMWSGSRRRSATGTAPQQVSP